MHIRPHEFIVLSPNIDVFCAKIQLPVIQHTFTFAGDHIVDLWWEQALLRLTNHDSGTIMPATEGSDVVKAGGLGLWSWGEWRWNGWITHNKHPEGLVPIIGCDDQIVSTKCEIRETPGLQTNTSTKDFKLAPSMSRRARIRTRQWSCGWRTVPQN